MPEQNWSLRGEYMESCNCDYLCPCVYTNPQGPATYDNCTAVMVFRIDDGRSGATRLDGLKFALVIRSGKVMADGNWVFGAVVDAAADPAQRQALSAIASGETRDIHRQGGRYLTLVGTNPLFHLPQDRWPEAVDLDAITRITAAAMRIVLALAHA